MSDTYEIYAVRYAHHDRPGHANFITAPKDLHDVPMPLDYFVWVIKGENGTFLLDTGFSEQAAKKRGRQIVRPVGEGLEALGLPAHKVSDVIISHMHYDHAGNLDLFPNARFHIQDAEMAFCTGRCMGHDFIGHHFEVEDVTTMVRRVFEGRAQFHEGTSELAPGLTLHKLGGHTKGLQAVRVKTQRGYVVLASDAAHLYANMELKSPFPAVVDIDEYLDAFDTIRALATSEQHIVPGHDPMVLEIYPQAFDNAPGIVRLDIAPKARP
jgi:glyoxylase-like metal-dependent hydrolase (beta-lactamase superfamily II)